RTLCVLDLPGQLTQLLVRGTLGNHRRHGHRLFVMRNHLLGEPHISLVVPLFDRAVRGGRRLARTAARVATGCGQGEDGGQRRPRHTSPHGFRCLPTLAGSCFVTNRESITPVVHRPRSARSCRGTTARARMTHAADGTSATNTASGATRR